ncbi:YceD family protein [Leucobacter sp. M11]|uniref:YceD family protein n=1 Tax=Leucobacter sp. M11 TaxID=2993565 RepID=UPI002D9088E7|nr:DUF177 domain-containing protein [Leucobacter sp. M11]
MREREREIVVPDQLGEGLIHVPAGEQLFLDVRLESVHEGILATVSVETTAHGECGRCLEAIQRPVELEFHELFPYDRQEADEYGVQDDSVDLESPLRDAVVLALPFQPVCRPDCPGLDPVTGEKRQDGAAEESLGEVDPRWAALTAFTASTDSGTGDAPNAG